MISNLILLENSEKCVRYAYSSPKSYEAVDGEIMLDKGTEMFSLIRCASNDEKGFAAQWLLPHLSRIIVDENCPKNG